MFPGYCFFGVNLKSICSTLKNGKCYANLNEVCFILLKLINEVSGSDTKLSKEKLKLLENINDGKSELEGELVKSNYLHFLSAKSK